MADEDLNPRLRDVVDSLGQTRSGCPSSDALVEYEALAPRERTRHRIDAHVQVCSRCQLVLLHLAEPPGTARRITWVLPVAAALLIGVLTPLIYRAVVPDQTSEAVRGADLQPIAPAGTVPGVREFKWQSPIRAARYRVRLYRGSDVIWTSTTESTRVAVDPSLAFEGGVEYAWQVEALDREGDVRLTAPRQVFTVAGVR